MFSVIQIGLVLCSLMAAEKQPISQSFVGGIKTVMSSSCARAIEIAKSVKNSGSKFESG